MDLRNSKILFIASTEKISSTAPYLRCKNSSSQHEPCVLATYSNFLIKFQWLHESIASMKFAELITSKNRKKWLSAVANISTKPIIGSMQMQIFIKYFCVILLLSIQGITKICSLTTKSGTLVCHLHDTKQWCLYVIYLPTYVLYILDYKN